MTPGEATPVGDGYRASHMATEMHEQPTVLGRLAGDLESVALTVRELVAADGVAGGCQLPGVAFIGRGSSGHAALFGRYLVELASGPPVSLIAPSLLGSYGVRPEAFEGWLVVALSQSGRTPEITTAAETFARCGAQVIAVTNDYHSELSTVARITIGVGAGPERSVPATKTVTAQMLAMVGLAAGLATAEASVRLRNDTAQVAGAVGAVLADLDPAIALARELAAVRRLAVVGRGLCYPAALEVALKLQETTGIMAQGFSAAEFRHGPIAVCGPEVPALLVAGSGPADDDTMALTDQLVARNAPVWVIGTSPGAALPWRPVPHTLDAIMATVRGQQLALALAQEVGVDVDRPFGLDKITLTY